MSQFVDANSKGFLASAAITQYARVILDAAGTVSTAGLTGREIGTALNAAFAAGDQVMVKLRTGAGTHKMIAAGAVTNGAFVHGQASGKVDDVATATGYPIGTALEAATANNDIIEVLYAHTGTVNP
jgi:hypothetical protein